MRKILIIILLIFMVSLVWAADQDPVTVSPGEKTDIAIIEQSCPTFSWTAVSWAAGYRIAVFKADRFSLGLSYEEKKTQEDPVLMKDIKGSALSWTPCAKNRLTNGQEYIWFVQAIDVNGSGVWSEGNRFKVVTELSFASIEEKLKEKLEDSGVSSESIARAFEEVKIRDTGDSYTEKRKETGTNNPGISRPLGTENANYTYYGIGAGGTSTATGNSFFGVNAGNSNTTGYRNTFSGSHAGNSNTTGYENTFSGHRAGYSNTTGYRNTFSGHYAGYSNTTGYYNTFSGSHAGYSNTTGNYNTFSGYNAGYANTEGHHNTLSGYRAGWSNTTGNYNTFFGYRAGYFNSTGSGNLFLGYQAGYNETGSYKLYIDNSNIATPLIYGEFDNDLVKINGDFRVTGYLSLDNGTTQISSTELNLLDGKTSVATGTSNNDILVTKGYVDDNSGGLTGSALTDQYISKWDNANTRLVNSLILESGTNIGINGSLSLNNNTLSLNNGTTTISSTELNLLDGRTSVATGTSNNNILVTKGYVDENDDVGVGGLTGSSMTDKYICKWDDGNTRLVDSILYESGGEMSINGRLGVSAGSTNYNPSYEVDVDGYVRTKYFMQQSADPQMRWYETDGSDPADFFKMNYHDNRLEFIWYDASTATTYVPIRMKGNGYVGINNTNPTHMLDVGTSGAYCNGGAWIDGSSIEYKENIQNVELDEAIDTLKDLKPIKYNYKEDKEEQYLGFIAEDVPELVAMNERNGLHTMDVVTVLTKVVQDQQKEIKTLKEQQKKLKNEKKINNKQNELLNEQKELLNNQNKIIENLVKRIEKLEE